jgi:hypothetical protein
MGATLAASSASAGNWNVLHRVQPDAMASTSTLTGALVRLHSVAAAISATSHVSISSGGFRLVTPNPIAATSTISAAFTVVRPLAVGAPLASSSIAATLARTRSLGAAYTATSTLTGAFVRIRSLDTACTATSTLAGALGRLRPLTADALSSTSTVTASFAGGPVAAAPAPLSGLVVSDVDDYGRGAATGRSATGAAPISGGRTYASR